MFFLDRSGLLGSVFKSLLLLISTSFSRNYFKVLEYGPKYILFSFAEGSFEEQLSDYNSKLFSYVLFLWEVYGSLFSLVLWYMILFGYGVSFR